jgi:hypothetical protein
VSPIALETRSPIAQETLPAVASTIEGATAIVRVLLSGFELVQ